MISPTRSSEQVDAIPFQIYRHPVRTDGAQSNAEAFKLMHTEIGLIYFGLRFLRNQIVSLNLTRNEGMRPPSPSQAVFLDARYSSYD